MKPNPGRLPAEAKGKRVHVRLVNGYTTVGKEPAGWPADTQGWAKTGSVWDIAEYEVI